MAKLKFEGWVVVLKGVPCGENCYASFSIIKQNAKVFLGVMRVSHPEVRGYEVKKATLEVDDGK